MSERRGVALQHPLSPSSGGAWEILVKSVKTILHSLAGERALDDEAIHSLLVEVENILNNRPPTPVSDHALDLSVLTPASLLTGTLDSCLPADVFIEADGFRRSWRSVQLLADCFWKRWVKEYLPLLQHRQKWSKHSEIFALAMSFLCVKQTLNVVIGPRRW